MPLPLYTFAGISIFCAMCRRASSRSGSGRRGRLPAGARGARLALLVLGPGLLLPSSAAARLPQQDAPRHPRPPGPGTATHAQKAPGQPAAGRAAPAPVDGGRAVSAKEPDSVTTRSGPWKAGATGRADIGYDTNVFQTDLATGDAFTELGTSLFATRDDGHSLLRGRVGVSRKFYRRFSRADEVEGFADLTGTRQLGPLRAGALLSSSYLDLRVLDREGNLLPRTTFASLSHRALAFGDLRLTKNLYLSGEGSYRFKNYEETQSLPSLDYHEWLADVGLTRYLPGRFSLRLLGTWSERDYTALQAADSSGLIAPDNPGLHLRRLEGEARLRRRWGKNGLFQASFAVRRGEDLFRDELSADQRSASVRLQHEAAGFLLDLYGSVVGRHFDLRRSGGGAALRETYWTLDADLERALWAGARLNAGYELFRRSTNDVLGGYTVGTWQLGLLHAF